MLPSSKTVDCLTTAGRPEHEGLEFWRVLFPPPAGGVTSLSIPARLLKRHGAPFLLLPRSSRAARTTLSLYPAQTQKARAARALLSLFLKAGFAPGAQSLDIAVNPADLFVDFIRAQSGAGTPSARAQLACGLPGFGILAGNPNTAGRRYVILVFTSANEPAAVIKAGVSPRARALIEKEHAFLSHLSAGLPGVPGVLATFQDERLSAISMSYAAGNAPSSQETRALGELLTSWLSLRRSIRFGASPEWQRLKAACSGNALLEAIAKALATVTCSPALSHGDFAPWNIRVAADGKWTVLDWERGELEGLPAWDWFHFALQPAILVERLATAALVGRCEDLLDSPPFQAYASKAGILDIARPLLLSYLLYCVEVIKPSEGLAQTRELLAALAARWINSESERTFHSTPQR